MGTIVHPADYKFQADLLLLQYKDHTLVSGLSGAALSARALASGMSSEFQQQIKNYSVVNVSNEATGLYTVAFQNNQTKQVIFSISGADTDARKLQLNYETDAFGYGKTALEVFDSFKTATRLQVESQGSAFNYVLTGTSAGGQLGYFATLEARLDGSAPQLYGTYLFEPFPYGAVAHDSHLSALLSEASQSWLDPYAKIVTFTNGDSIVTTTPFFIRQDPEGYPLVYNVSQIKEGLVHLDAAPIQGNVLDRYYQHLMDSVDGSLTLPGNSDIVMDAVTLTPGGSSVYSTTDGRMIVGSSSATTSGSSTQITMSQFDYTGQTVGPVSSASGTLDSTGRIQSVTFTDGDSARSLNLQELAHIQLGQDLQATFASTLTMLQPQPLAFGPVFFSSPLVAAHANGSDWTIDITDAGLRYDARAGRLTMTEDAGGGATRRYDLRQRRDGDGMPIADAYVIVATHEIDRGLEVTTYRDGTGTRTDLRLSSSPIGIDFADAGQVLGSVLGNYLAGGNRVTGAFASGALSTVLSDLGQVLNGVATGHGLEDSLDKAFSDFGADLADSLTSAGVGAISSFLTAELVNALGVDGFAGELTNTVAGSYVSAIIANLPALLSNTKSLSQVLGSVNVGNVLGSFLGTKLASEIVHFDTVGGQIGAAVGSALGAIAATQLAEAGTLLAGPLGAAIGAFVGFIVGGLIGSLFGGTPRSGADVEWDASQGKFVVANVYSKQGGSKQAARSMASSAAGTFNAILSATGGELLNPEAVQAGNYGMRKKDFVYRPSSTRDKDAITQRFKGKDGATRLIGYGLYQGLTDPDFQIAGGDTYVKRAIYNGLALGGIDPTNFDAGVILGNIATAQRYENYLASSTAVNALVAAEPDSVFTAEMALTLSRAVELGLTRRAASDWFGGFGHLMKEAGTNAAGMEFGFDYDPFSGQISRQIGAGAYIMGDAIDVAGQTTIEGGVTADAIDLRSGKLADQRGYIVDGESMNDIAVSGTDFTTTTGTLSFAPTELRKSFTVAVVNDGIAEGAEAFLASLSTGSGMTVVGAPSVATISEAALPSLMVGSSYAAESDGYAVFRLSLSKAATSAVTVALALADGRAAGLGVDYGAAGVGSIQVSGDGVTWANATSATFAVGVTQLFVRTAVKADNGVDAQGKPTNVEGNETFTLTATVTAGATALANGGAPVSGTGTIVDGTSTAPLVWIDDVVVNETSGTATFTVSRSRTAAAAATVAYATSDRRALAIDVAATVDAGDGDDRVDASDFGDNVFGGAGNDTLYGGRLDDWLLGGDGNDTLDAGAADQSKLGGDGNYLDGGAGNDVVRGREGSDWLEGGDGVDTLTGGAGDDILAGGAGDGDSEKGGTGDDQYLVRRGDGADVAEEDPADAPASTGVGDAITQRIVAIEKWKVNPAQAGVLRPDWVGTSAGVTADKATGGDDALVFGDGIELGDIRLQRSVANALPGNDLIVIVTQLVNGVETDSGTRITIKDWFTNPFKRVEWLKFVDGTEVRIADVTSFIIGGSGNDTLIGTAGNDFVYGGAGNDRLFLLAGDDIGNGGTGDDMVAGGTGRDLVVGGLGNDELIGGKGADALTGDAGADDLYGGDDADVLSGGRGDGDQVVGGAGDDIFKYARGDGNDTMFDDFVASGWSNIWANGAWGAGYTYNSATGEVTGPGGVLVRKNVGTAALPDLQWIGRFDYDDATGTLKRYTPPATGSMVANNGNDTLELAPGINIQDVILRRVGNDLILAISDDSADVTDTSKVADSITIKDWYVAGLTGEIEKFAFYQTGILDVALGKTNLIAGSDANDGIGTAPLAGTAGADWMTGAAGDDVLAGGAGNDILAGDSGSDILRGEAGDDVLYGGTGNDQLDGGAGKDMLIGGAGLDIASYASATAAVRAHLSASTTNAGDAVGDEYDTVEGLTGGSGADVLGGDAGQNELAGGMGDDLLMGGVGDDTYIWNAGDGSDTIHDGAFTVEEAVTTAGALAAGYSVASWASTGITTTGGTYWRLQVKNASGEIVYDYDKFVETGTAPPQHTPSTYVLTGWKNGFVRTNGQQVTRERFDAVSDGGSDVLELGPNLSLTDLAFVWSGNDLFLRNGGAATQQIRLQDQKLAISRVELLQLADGQAVSLANVLVAASGAQLVGSSGDDLLVGQPGTAAYNLAGGDGNDVLVGYGGADLLYGGNGDDVLEGGAGADRLDGGANSLIGSIQDAGDTIRYVRSAAGVTVDLNNAGAQAGGDAAGDVLVGIENVVGSALGDTLTGDAGGNRLAGLDGNDTIRGGAGDDVVLGDLGDDLLYGDAGMDDLSGSDGNDQLWGGTEDDRLDGGDGNDKLYGEDGADTLTAGAGDDILDGGIGDDVLVGDLGNDTLTGGDGNDTLQGGDGTDSLNGGLGNDSFVFSATSGVDTIVDASGTNVISFDDSVAYDQLWMTRSGNDLRIGVIGGSATITVTGFYAATGPSVMRSIQTTTHAYYLDNTDSLNLVATMTAAGATTPAAMPASVTALLSTYWHAGGKAAPTASATPRAISGNEDTVIAVSGAWGVVDHDGGPITYSVKPDALPTIGTITAINASTGALTYMPNPNANGADSFSILATDSDGQSVELKVIVAVAPVNDPPGIMTVASGALSVAESAINSLTTVGTSVAQLSSIDPDGDLVTFSMVNDAGGRFQISPSGLINVKTPSLLDYESGPSQIITIKASDGNGGELQQNFTIAIANVNEPNTMPTSYGMTIAENLGVGTLVAPVAATDVDSGANAFGQQRYFFLNGATASATSSDGRYTIDAVSGAIKTALVLNYESGPTSVTYSVVARDNQGLAGYNQATSSVTIAVVNVNEANSLPATYAMGVAENVALGTVVGAVTATDLDGASSAFGQQRYYFLNGTTAAATSSDGRYVIDALTGVVKTAGALNFEGASPSATYKVIARDNQGNAPFNQVSSDVTIGITDVNEANSLPASYGMTIAESAAVGTTVGTVAATDPDASAIAFGQQRYYFLNGTIASATSSDGRYTIDAVTGAIKTASALNYESAPTSCAYTVVARDNSGNAGYFQATTTVTIGVTDVNEAPIAMSWSPTTISVSERDRAATGVTLDPIALATFSVADPDTAASPFATYSYSVSDSRFEFVGNTLRLKLGAVLDYEASPTLSLTVTGTDTSGSPLTIQRAVTINVVNTDDYLYGTSAADNLVGQQNRDLIYGYAGNDVIDGGAGDDLLDGGNGSDRLIGGTGNNTLYGGDDDDVLLGNSGIDTLYGGTNTVGTYDRLYGDAGDDLLYGEDGDDYLVGGAGKDKLDGGTGSDWADYSLLTEGAAAMAGVTVDLTTPSVNTGTALGDTYVSIENILGTGFDDVLGGDANANALVGGAGNDTLRGRAGDDSLSGGVGNDSLYGDDGADILNGDDGDDIIYGGAGDDKLYGGAGADQLYAESGDDLLDGGAGNDILNGGTENDTYLLTRTSDADTINNFDPSGADIDVLGLQDSAGAINDQDLWFERSGNDMIVSIVGTTSSARIKDWYVMTGVDGSNYKIDFIVAGTRYSRSINLDGLVALMATKTKPATLAARDVLLADLNYKAKWATYWGTNAAPVLSAIAAQTLAEDVPLTLTVTATDDITPANGIAVTAQILSGASVVPLSGLVFGAPDASGKRSLKITPAANVAGSATIRVTASDAGGVTSYQDFSVTVTPVADTPIIASFVGGSGTSGLAGGVALTANVTFPDTDGSEVQELWIAGVPAGVTFSAGTYDSVAAVWKLTPAQATGLKVNAPAGWSQDLNLTLTARATEGGVTATASATTSVVLNAPPTSLSLSGSIAENSVNGTAAATISGVDPDGDTLSFSLLDNAGGRFALSAAGALTVANGALLNYEAAQSHAITVRATDRFGATRDQVLTIAVTNVNEAPNAPTGVASAFFDETGLGTAPANAGVVLATYGLSDPDGTTPTLQLTANPGGWFTVSGNTVKFVGANLDFETFRSLGYAVGDYDGDGKSEAYIGDVKVRASDGSLTSIDTVTKVYIRDVNETPAAPSGPGAVYFDEAGLGSKPANAGVIAASYGLSDPDGTTPSLQLVSGPTGWFYIDGSTTKFNSDLGFDGQAAQIYRLYDVALGRVPYLSEIASWSAGMTAHAADAQPAGENWAVNAASFPDVNMRALEWAATSILGDGGVQQRLGGSDNATFIRQLYQSAFRRAATADEVAVWSANMAAGWTRGGMLAFFSEYPDHRLVTNGGILQGEANFEWARAAGYAVADRNGDGRLEAYMGDLVVRASDGSLNSATTTTQVYISNVNEAPDAPEGSGAKFFDETGLGPNPANPGVVLASFGLSDPDGTTPALVLTANPNNSFELSGNSVRFKAGINLDFEALRSAGYTVNDYNGDGRLDAYVGNVMVAASDGSLTSGNTITPVYISDVNERPNPLALTMNTLLQETTGSGGHGDILQAQFGLSDPDGPVPSLVIVGGNDYGWFRVNGNYIQVSPGVNWSADWLRASKGYYGTDPGYYYDTNGNGLMEIRVATLTVVAQDASGARSDPFTYNVLVEDKNEAPLFSQPTFTFKPNENPGWYQQVGTVTGSDIDGPASELRYGFTGAARYYDGNLGRYVSATPDARFLLDDNGNVFVGGTQNLDFESGQINFSYSMTIYDKARGANVTSSTGTLAIQLYDVDEPHSMSSQGIDVSETDHPLGPIAPVYFLSSLLSDPERGRNIRYQFSDGSLIKSGWQIDPSTGQVWMSSVMDYEALTDIYTTVPGYGTYLTGNDPTRATFNLSVQAINSVTGQSAQGTLTINVKDVNEGPTFTSYSTQSSVVFKGNTDYWVPGGKNGGDIIQINAQDPEHKAGFTYSINGYGATETNWTLGGSSDIDATGYPMPSISSTGLISFYTPGEGNGGEWEGGTKIAGVRKTSTVNVTFNLNITDSTGVTSSTPFSIEFMRRGSSVPPLVLDLDGDGLELTSADGSTVQFDMDGDGVRDTSGWVGADDGILALDRNGNGIIDDIKEISFVNDAQGAVSDLEGLRAFDTNDDNFLDVEDERFGEFEVWQDANHDGISQANELKSLDEAGITHIGLTLTRSDDTDVESDDNGDNTIYGTTAFTRSDGSQGLVGDVFFAYEPSDLAALAAPIILDLDHDGKTVVPLSDSSTMFDTVGDGSLRRTAWVDQGDAFLVRDRNADGLINDIHDISFVGDKAGAKTDLEGLAAFDDNGDGLLNGEDASFVGFGAWIDANSNGITDAGELLSLAQAGITSIDLTGTSTGETAAGRASGESVIFNTAGFDMADGSTGSLSDVGLAYDTTPLGKAGTGNVVFSEIGVDQDRDAKRFRLAAANGSLFVRPHHPKGALDAAAGKIGSATLLTFADRSVGLLDPIILDLDGDGLEVNSRKKSHAMFDMDGDGVADDTGWIGKGEGFLVIDSNNDGLITTPDELSFLGEKAGLTSSYAGLATLDANKDNKIDKTDARFADLKVWVDENRDGAVEAGELKTLTDIGITALSLTTTPLSVTAKLGDNVGLSTSTFTRADGSTGTMGEAALAFAPSSLTRSEPDAPPDQLAGIPQSAAAASSSSSVMPLAADPASHSAALGRQWDASSFEMLHASESGSVVARFGVPESRGTLKAAQLDASRMIEAISGFGISAATSDHLPTPANMRDELIAFAASH